MPVPDDTEGDAEVARNYEGICHEVYNPRTGSTTSYDGKSRAVIHYPPIRMTK